MPGPYYVIFHQKERIPVLTIDDLGAAKAWCNDNAREGYFLVATYSSGNLPVVNISAEKAFWSNEK